MYFCGRLAQYRYFNTDEATLEALRCFQEMRKRCAGVPEPGAMRPQPSTNA